MIYLKSTLKMTRCLQCGFAERPAESEFQIPPFSDRQVQLGAMQQSRNNCSFCSLVCGAMELIENINLEESTLQQPTVQISSGDTLLIRGSWPGATELELYTDPCRLHTLLNLPTYWIITVVNHSQQQVQTIIRKLLWRDSYELK